MQMQLDVARWRRILVARLDNIGDVVMMTPALRALRAALPHAHVTAMLSPGGSQLAPLLPWIDDVLVERVTWQDVRGELPHDPQREFALLDKLRACHFDASLIFTSFSQSPWPLAYLSYLAGIPFRVGQSKEFGGSVLTHAVTPLTDSVHQVDRNLHLLGALGLAGAGSYLELDLPPGPAHSARALLHEFDVGAPFVALGIGASCSARRYDARRFGLVARGLIDAGGLSVVLIGSAREVELAERVREAAGRDELISLVGRTSVPEMAAVIASATLVIANNSAAMHMADAFGRPSVVLFGGTELERQWRPRNSPTRLLRRPTGCSPCYGFTCAHHHECLDLPPQTVIDAALRLLSETQDAETVRVAPGQGGARCADFVS